MECPHCERGELWTECCSGASGCACQGRQVYMGPCQVCGGTGHMREDADRDANIRFIKAFIVNGYIGNPFCRLR
jgi:hypothetical protein